MRKFLSGCILLISLLLNAGLLWAASGGGGAAAHHGMPFSYIIAWVVLIIVGGLVFRACKKSCVCDEHAAEHAPAEHGHEAPKGGAVPMFLMLAVAFLFLTESLSAMGHYHEPFLLGALRFIIKMGSGILLMFYGLSFMHEHDEH